MNDVISFPVRRRPEILTAAATLYVVEFIAIPGDDSVSIIVTPDDLDTHGRENLAALMTRAAAWIKARPADPPPAAA